MPFEFDRVGGGGGGRHGGGGTDRHGHDSGGGRDRDGRGGRGMHVTWNPEGRGRPGPQEGPPRYGQIRIDTDEWKLYLDLYDTVPVPAVDTGWTLIDRPDDVSITEWDGSEPDREAVTVLLDGFRHERGVDRDIDRLRSLTDVEEDANHPPVFTVRGGGLRLADRKVVLETLEWGDVQERRHPDDVPTRQAMTLGLLRYVKGDQIKIKKRKPKTYTTKEGDTLKKVAAKVNKGDDKPSELADLARQIGKLNDIRDVNKKLKPGTKLKLPS